MPDTHEGGCLCGAVRYRVAGKPSSTGICSCTFCKRRTGSAFGVGAYFDDGSALQITKGTLKTYEYRSDETRRWLRMEFCPNCGTSVTWTAEWQPGGRAVALGTFDEPDWVQPEWAVWARSALKWVVLPASVEAHQTDPELKPE